MKLRALTVNNFRQFYGSQTIRFATGKDKNVTVLVRVDPKDVRSLDRTRVFGRVDLSGKPKGTYTMPVQVVLPPDVTLVKVIPDKVSVTLY